MQMTKKHIAVQPKKIKSASPEHNQPATTTESEESLGQLTLDIYQTDTHLVIVAPIAGVKINDIDVSVTEDVLTIKGKRQHELTIATEDYFTQECFWGDFSRSVVLPASVDASKISASFKDSILKVTIPKTDHVQSKVIRIKPE